MITTLYKRLKTGKIQVWKIEVITDQDALPVIIRSTYQYPDGKVKTTKTKIKVGKNLGKSNEQSPMGQAIFKEGNYIKEKIEDNMVSSIKDVDLPPTYIYAQLAEPFREDKLPTDYFYAQPKYNGIRATRFGHLGQKTLLSRKLKDYSALKHIKKAIEKVFPDNISPDGEAYIHGLSLQGISSLSKKYREKANKPEHKGYCTEDLKFYIFDLAIPNKTFEERMEVLESILPAGGDHPILRRVPTFKCKDMEEYQVLKVQLIEMGYEGIMSRDGRSLYGFNERDSTLMKDKDFIDKEFKIVDYTYEDWYNTETDTYEKMVIWICETDKSIRFNSRPLGSFESRILAYKTASKQLEKYLTVKYQDLSDVGVPNFNVGVCIRDYE